MKKILCTFFLLVMLSTVTYANEKEISFTPFPVIAYSGTTSLMLGAILFVNFDDSNNKEAETDRIQFLGIYTLKHQTISNVGLEKYLNHDTILYTARIGFVRFPTDFYGIGSDNSLSDRETFSSDSIPVTQFVLFRLSPKGETKLWLGPSYQFKHVHYYDVEEGGLLDSGTVAGIDGTRVSAPGLRLLYDSRDNTIWTTRGNALDIQTKYNTSYVGATQDSLSLRADYRHFWDIEQIVSSFRKRTYIFGIHSFWEGQWGDVPLTLMNEMGPSGNESILRGYDERFIDTCKYAFESEFRFPIWKRLAGTLFGGFGNVSDDPFAFASRHTHDAGGFGLRYAIVDREDKMNFRFDIAYNRKRQIRPSQKILIISGISISGRRPRISSSFLHSGNFSKI